MIKRKQAVEAIIPTSKDKIKSSEVTIIVVENAITPRECLEQI